MMRKWWMVPALILAVQSAPAQSVRSLVNGGNDLYLDRKFADAEVNYRKALEKEKDLVQGHFNLGNALAKQGKNEEAAKEFDLALQKAEQRDTKAYAWYNIGNTHMADQRYEDAVRSYVDALKLNPRDEEAKYNLSYALEKLRQQQQQQQQNKNDKNKNDKNKNDKKKNDKNKQDNQKQNQDQNKDKNQDKNQDKNKQNPPDQQNQAQNRPQQQDKRMSRADAERILEVLKNSEKDVQKKLRARPAGQAKTDKDW
jgi:tetratricopeptide (TPR) repeat protein